MMAIMDHAVRQGLQQPPYRRKGRAQLVGDVGYIFSPGGFPYLESGSRKQRTHRLITRGAAIESIAPQTKELSEAEFYSRMESILNLPQACLLYTSRCV